MKAYKTFDPKYFFTHVCHIYGSQAILPFCVAFNRSTQCSRNDLKAKADPLVRLRFIKWRECLSSNALTEHSNTGMLGMNKLCVFQKTSDPGIFPERVIP